MILDAFSNFHYYLTLHPLFPMVSEFIAAHDCATMEAGKFAIGRGITLSINEYVTKPSDEKKAEYHRKYIDVQLLLSGCEMFGYCDRTLSEDRIPYDGEKDAGFAAGDLDFCTLPAGFFAVFFPHDLHMPGVCVKGAAGMVKKAVFKVPV
jgi:biofilm protein TabA